MVVQAARRCPPDDGLSGEMTGGLSTPGGRPGFHEPVVARRYATTGTGAA